MNMNVESTGTAAEVVEAVESSQASVQEVVVQDLVADDVASGEVLDSMIAELLHAAPSPAAAPEETWEPQVVAADDLEMLDPRRKMTAAVLLKRISDSRKILLPASGLLGFTMDQRDARLKEIRNGARAIPDLWVTNSDKGLRAVELAEHERRMAKLKREAEQAQFREDLRKRRAAEEVVKQMGAEKAVVVATVKDVKDFGAILQVTPEVDGLLHVTQIVGGRRTLLQMQVKDEVEVVVLPCEETKSAKGHPRLKVSLSQRLVPFARMQPGDAMIARVLHGYPTEFSIKVAGESAVLPHDKLGIVDAGSIAREPTTRVKFVGIELRTYEAQDGTPRTTYQAVFSK